jgi:hypothetical protein
MFVVFERLSNLVLRAVAVYSYKQYDQQAIRELSIDTANSLFIIDYQLNHIQNGYDL